MLQVYTGNGKGKTTAALGVALRATGHGMRVLFLQFMKEGGPLTSGESVAAERLPQLHIEQFGRSFIYEPKPSVEEVATRVRAGLQYGLEQSTSGECDLLVLDELNVVLASEVIEIVEVTAFLDHLPEQVQVIITGRGAPSELRERASLVSEVAESKHPFRQGHSAVEGIDY